MRKVVKIMKALGDRNRMRIIKLLQHKNGICVCEIQKLLGVGQSTTSRHLRILEEADLLYSEREGKWVNFFLNERNQSSEIRSILTMLDKWLKDDRQVQMDIKAISTIDRAFLVPGG
jgi:ArsR family transcriptional regulator, arsenate/arsenite/antimonite-responsive transcriptional repressor